MFEPLLADIWASLYKMKPKIRAEDVDSVLKSTNHSWKESWRMKTLKTTEASPDWMI